MVLTKKIKNFEIFFQRLEMLEKTKKFKRFSRACHIEKI